MTNYTDVFGSSTVPPAQQGLAVYTLAGTITLSWPEDPSTDYVAAGIIELNASGDQTVLLPDATKSSTGRDILIRVTGSGAITLQDNVGGAVATLAQGKSYFIYLENNSTVAGSWKFFTYGATTSTADAAALAGAGMSANGVLLQQNIQTTSISGTTAITTNDRATLLVASGGSYSVTLTAASGYGEGYFFYLTNTGSGTVTIDPNGAETIDGSATKGIPPTSSVIVFTDGAAWYTVGYGRDIVFAFSQYSIVATSGTVTLASGDVSGRMISLQNPLTGNMTVVLPATVGIYFFKSNTWAGGYTVTLQIGSPASGSTLQLASTENATLYADGTNIVSAMTDAVVGDFAIIDGSVTTPAIRFVSDSNTGIYRKGADQLSLAAGGVEVATATTTGLEIAVGPAANNHAATKLYVDSLAFSTSLPGQAGNSGKYLQTDGVNATWQLSIASQTGNGGKFLTTDGTTESWANIVGVGVTAVLKGDGSGLPTTATAGTDFSKPDTAESISASRTYSSSVAETPVVANTTASYTVTDRSMHDLTLTANCTFTFPALAAGKQFTMFLKQDATGSRTVTWPATVRWPAGTAPNITTTASRTDIISFICDGTYWLGTYGNNNYTRA